MVNIKDLIFTEPSTLFSEAVRICFKEIEPGQGFEYIVGKIKGGKLKIVFELDDIGSYTAEVFDGVDAFGITLVVENKKRSR